MVNVQVRMHEEMGKILVMPVMLKGLASGEHSKHVSVGKKLHNAEKLRFRQVAN